MLKMELATDSCMSSHEAQELAACYVKAYRDFHEDCLLILGVECLANPFFLTVYDIFCENGLKVYVENGGMLLEQEMIDVFREFMESSEDANVENIDSGMREKSVSWSEDSLVA